VDAIHVRAAARALYGIFGRRRRRRAKGGDNRLHDKFMGGANGGWNFRGGLVHRPTLTGVQEKNETGVQEKNETGVQEKNETGVQEKNETGG
jgi:hypothetical protein